MEDHIETGELDTLLTNSVEDIFSVMFAIGVSFKGAKEMKGFEANADLTGLMFIEGERIGMVACSMPRALGLRIASALTGLGEADITTPDICDIIAEFVNMVCGRIKSHNTFSRGLKLTPPLAIAGSDHMVVWKTSQPTRCLAFEAEGGESFEIIVNL